MKHNEYSVRVRTTIDGEEFLETFIIGPEREYTTLQALYEELCKITCYSVRAGCRNR